MAAALLRRRGKVVDDELPVACDEAHGGGVEPVVVEVGVDDDAAVVGQINLGLSDRVPQRALLLAAGCRSRRRARQPAISNALRQSVPVARPANGFDENGLNRLGFNLDYL
uniref:Uncharacterized protein n=1 Tax=Oryza brachyantha TaxID=4533 RepID=J3MIG2_ORYBR